jgi:hypothetical protein
MVAGADGGTAAGAGCATAAGADDGTAAGAGGGRLAGAWVAVAMAVAGASPAWAATDKALAAARIAPVINFDGNIKCSFQCTVRSSHDRHIKNTMCPVRPARLQRKRV